MPTTPPYDVQYLDLADYLWLAGAALDPDLVTKARVILVHLTKNHPLPDGNKRAPTWP